MRAGGEFSESISRQEILLVFDRLAEEEPLTTTEVAEELPIGRRALHDRLEKMSRDGDLGKKDFGNRVVWWAEIAPALAPDLAEELEATADEETYVSLDELDDV
ncbi:hypothetical protein [Halolamina sp.]|uniref:hypothetical protein n=1 Tax=Halolamina sp. TaxID=1940283 RepID=UPI003563ACE8